MNLFAKLVAALGLVAIVYAGAAACRKGGGDTADFSAELPAFSGCAAVRVGPVCELAEERRLVVWLPNEVAWDARTEEGPLAARRRQSVGGGFRYDVTVPPGARWVAFRDPAQRFARLRVSEPEPPNVLTRADALRKAGQLTAAEASLHAAETSGSEDLRWRVRALLARIDFARGEFPRAAERLEATFEAARRAGRISDAVRDATALAYIFTRHLHDYPRARTVLASAAELAKPDPSSAALVPYYAGLVDRATGALRRALAQFRAASRQLARLGLTDHELLARETEASVLSMLGRHDEAIERQREVVASFPTGTPCVLAQRRETLAWLIYLSNPKPDSTFAEQADSALKQAETWMSSCDETWSQRNHWINVGLLALQRDDIDHADAALARLQASQADPSTALAAWEALLRGRVAAARGACAAALVHFERAVQLGRSAGLWEIEHSSQLEQGRCHRERGDFRRAVASLEAAEQSLERLVIAVPFGEGRHAFLSERASSSEMLMDVWLRLGQPRRALEVGRRARARLLRSVIARSTLETLSPTRSAAWEAEIARFQQLRAAFERTGNTDWKVPNDQLQRREQEVAELERAVQAALDRSYELLHRQGVPRFEPLERAPEEALLAYFRSEDVTLRFVDSGKLSVRRVPEGSLDALVAGLSNELAGMTRIRILTDAALQEIDVHALLVDGTPLVERYAVRYGLDLAVGSTNDPRGTHVLVITNPTRDLSNADGEGAMVQRALDRFGVAWLSGAGATRASVLAELDRTSLLHYAGHARFGGIDGIESGLELSDGWITVGDILARPLLPETVVLSACDGDDAAAGLSVAQAFAAAGSRAVVAAVRTVQDDATRTLMTGLYTVLRNQPDDVAAALREAQRMLRRDRPDADWASFRLLSP